MSAPMTREQRTQRLADLRARMAARNVVLSGGPLMSLPLNRRIAFAISDPGAITPRGDDYREPLHVWQARAIEFVLPNVSELEAQAEKVSAFCAQRAEYVTSILNCHPDNAHDYYRWQGHAESRRQLSERLGLPVAWPAEDKQATPPVSVEDPHDGPLHHEYALDLPELKAESPEATAERWNAQYPVGTPVFAYPGCRPEDDPKDEQLTTHTRSKAEVRGDAAVVWVDGHSACINLTHVDPRPETGGAS